MTSVHVYKLIAQMAGNVFIIHFEKLWNFNDVFASHGSCLVWKFENCSCTVNIYSLSDWIQGTNFRGLISGDRGASEMTLAPLHAPTLMGQSKNYIEYYSIGEQAINSTSSQLVAPRPMMAPWSVYKNRKLGRQEAPFQMMAIDSRVIVIQMTSKREEWAWAHERNCNYCNISLKKFTVTQLLL